MAGPRVSVIVPNYNHGRYLAERLDSVLSQSFEDIEVLVLDDASADDSLTVIRRFQSDPRVSVLVNEVNSGNPFVQWNRGVRRARGELIWIAESDDAAHPELLEVLVGRHDEHRDVVLSYCQSMKVDDSGAEIALNTEWTDDLDREHWRHAFVADGRDECRRYMVMKNVVPNASAVVFRRDAFERIGGAPEAFRYAGDWMTWVRLFLEGAVAFTPEPLNRYRQHAATVTRRSVLDGRWAEEGYQVLACILDSSRVDPGLKERALDRLMEKWTMSAVSPRSTMSAEAHRRIHDVASAIDDALMARARRAFRVTSHLRGLLFLLRLARLR